MPCIYKITNIINGDFYIGQTIDINKRWRVHLSHAKKSNRYLYRAMRKYGVENFTIESIFECKRELLCENEIRLISELSPKYNMTLGGERSDTISMKSEEEKALFRKRVSNSRKAQYEDTAFRQKMKESANDPNRREKISKALSGKNNHNWLGMVAMFDPSGNLIKMYETVSECCKDIKYGETTIRRCIRKNRCLKYTGQYKGYSFKYIKEGDTSIVSPSFILTIYDSIILGCGAAT